MKSTNYYMEYCYRSSRIRDRLNNDSSRNWILTKLSDHIRIPFSYFNALLGGLWARIKRLIHFGVHVDGCVIWTWKYQLIEILWMTLKHFPRYFGQGRNLFSVPIFVFLVEHNMYCLFITLSCCYLLTIDNDFSSPLS